MLTLTAAKTQHVIDSVMLSLPRTRHPPCFACGPPTDMVWCNRPADRADAVKKSMASRNGLLGRIEPAARLFGRGYQRHMQLTAGQRVRERRALASRGAPIRTEQRDRSISSSQRPDTTSRTRNRPLGEGGRSGP